MLSLLLPHTRPDPTWVSVRRAPLAHWETLQRGDGSQVGCVPQLLFRAAAQQPPLQDVEERMQLQQVRLNAQCHYCVRATGSWCFNTMEKRQHRKSVLELHRLSVMQWLINSVRAEVPLSAALGICMPIKRCPGEFKHIKWVPCTFRHIQPQSAAGEHSDYKSFGSWHPGWVLGNGKTHRITRSKPIMPLQGGKSVWAVQNFTGLPDALLCSPLLGLVMTFHLYYLFIPMQNKCKAT